MNIKKEEEKSVQVTITLEKSTYETLEKVIKKEDLPRSRFINRLLKRYFNSIAV